MSSGADIPTHLTLMFLLACISARSAYFTMLFIPEMACTASVQSILITNNMLRSDNFGINHASNVQSAHMIVLGILKILVAFL